MSEKWKIYLLASCWALMGLAGQSAANAQDPAREFRATWFTTHKSIDWPQTVIVAPEDTLKQQQEMTEIFDQLQAGNMNAICFQARPVADAFYRSSYEPWSPNLTGVRGQDPGYDPLAFAIREAHSRGMELHAWVNPFRYEFFAGERVADIEAFMASEDSDPIGIEHPNWLLRYTNGQFKGTILDPGNPFAREYVLKVVMEIVRNYDIDGLVMDDYFYPYGGTQDEDFKSQLSYQPDYLTVEDWRRENVNTVIRAIHDSIKAVKPNIRFGMSPFGIYSLVPESAAKYGLTLPEGITGTDAWATLYCDPFAWVEGGYVDYLSPQLYWGTTSTRQNYETLCRWWSESVEAIDARRGDGKRTYLYISHADYRFGAEELGKQIDINRQNAVHGVAGSIFYNTNQYLLFTGGKAQEKTCEILSQTHFKKAEASEQKIETNEQISEPSAEQEEVIAEQEKGYQEAEMMEAEEMLKNDTLPACCDTVSQDWQGNRFQRTALRQKVKREK